jgi:hypothetical protein
MVVKKLDRQFKSGVAVFVPVVDTQNRFVGIVIDAEEEREFVRAQTAMGCQGKGRITKLISSLQRVRKTPRLLLVNELEQAQALPVFENAAADQEHHCIVAVEYDVDRHPLVDCFAHARNLLARDCISQLLLETPTVFIHLLILKHYLECLEM